MDPTLSVPDILSCLSMTEIQENLPDHTFSYSEKRSRTKLHSAVYGLSQDHHVVLSNVAQCKKWRPTMRDEITAGSVKPVLRQVDEEDFFETVMEEVRRDCISNFIDATGRKATSTACCAMCAGQFFSNKITQVKVDDLRAKNVLSPTTPHCAHVLTNGMLLHRTPSSMYTTSDGLQHANICISCVKHL